MVDYKFHNENPLNAIEEDCVTRAISFAVNENYYKISDKLYAIADLYECEELCVCCYKHLIENYYHLPKINGFEGYTVEEFANYFPKGTYLLRGEGHITILKDSIIHDTGDCRDMVITDAWRAK